ncbi:hypothetical protein quinque_015948 [Culex quinquefasciatus]
MWKCHKCGKPVFFAERKQSLGYDWHPECLRCEECGKRLNPGQHAEHKGVPYCHVPCYGALFGPQLFGHGTRVESHKSFGAPELKKQTPHRSPSGGAGTVGPQIPRAHLESKLRAYNQFHDSKSAEVRSREVNGRLVLEGALRIYWGVQGIIHLKEDDDQRTVVTVRKRNSYRFSASSMAQQELEDQEDKENLNPDRSDPMSSSLTEGGDQNDTTTMSESISYDTLSISSDLNSISSSKPNSGENSKEVSPSHVVGNGTNKYVTLPPKLDVKQLEWDEIDDLLQVERKVDETEKPYRTMPSPLHSAKQASASDHSEITESVTDTDYKTLTPHSNSSSSDSNKTSATTTTLNGTEEDFRTPEGTLRSHDFDAFKMQMSQEFIDGAADLGSTDGTLKLNQPIDPARINDSLKLYNDSVMNRSLSEEQCRNAGVFSLPQGNITEHQLPCPIPDCANNFLPNLCHTHPSVYEDLQQNAAWADQSSASPLKSTYQIDYDHLQEYKLGPLPEDTKYFIRECNGTACGSCCAGGLCTCQLCPGGVDGCRGQYPDHGVQKPSKIPRGYVSSSHWPERPYQQERLMTEYRDRVSRTGHLVQREQLHNHQCCDQPSNCRHEFYLKK